MPRSKTAALKSARRPSSCVAAKKQEELPMIRRRSLRLMGQSAELPPTLVGAKKTRRPLRSARLERRSLNKAKDTTRPPSADANEVNRQSPTKEANKDILGSETSSTTISRSRRGPISDCGDLKNGGIYFKHLRPKHQSHRVELQFVVELIVRQLNNMPREYCRALVTYKKFGYQTLALCESDSSREVIELNGRRSLKGVAGAVVYRYLCERKVVELAYCVMLTERQGRGYGRILMARLIREMREKKVECILTYADNDAIGYFRKHGFTLCQHPSEMDSVIPSVPRSDWFSSIFHYNGATLMFCSLKRRGVEDTGYSAALSHGDDDDDGEEDEHEHDDESDPSSAVISKFSAADSESEEDSDEDGSEPEAISAPSTRSRKSSIGRRSSNSSSTRRRRRPSALLSLESEIPSPLESTASSTRFTGRGKGSLSTTAARDSIVRRAAGKRGLRSATRGIRTPQLGWISRISVDDESTSESCSSKIPPVDSIAVESNKSRKRKFDFSDDQSNSHVYAGHSSSIHHSLNNTKDGGSGTKRRRCGSTSSRGRRASTSARRGSLSPESSVALVSAAAQSSSASAALAMAEDDAISVDESSSFHERGSLEPIPGYSSSTLSSASSSSSASSAALSPPASAFERPGSFPPLAKPDWYVSSMVAQEASVPGSTSAAWRGRLRRRSGSDSPHKHTLRIKAQSSIVKQCNKLGCELSSLRVSIDDRAVRRGWDEIEAFVRFERLAQSHSDLDIQRHLKEHYKLSDSLTKKVLRDIDSQSDRMVAVDAPPAGHAAHSSGSHLWRPLTPNSWIITVCAEPRLCFSRVKIFRFDGSQGMRECWTGVELKQDPRYSISGKPDLFGWFYTDKESESSVFKLYGHQILSYVEPFQMRAESTLPRISQDFGQFQQITESLRQSRIKEAQQTSPVRRGSFVPPSSSNNRISNSSMSMSDSSSIQELSQSVGAAAVSVSSDKSSSLSISSFVRNLELSPGAGSGSDGESKGRRRSARIAANTSRAAIAAVTPVPSTTSPTKGDVSTPESVGGPRKRTLRLRLSKKKGGSRDKYGRQWFRLPTSLLRELCWRNHAEFRYCLSPTNSDFLEFYSKEFIEGGKG